MCNMRLYAVLCRVGSRDSILQISILCDFAMVVKWIFSLVMGVGLRDQCIFDVLLLSE
jgi:hypothetical protein